MLLTEKYITDVLNNTQPTIKPVVFRQWYFDKGTFAAHPRYIYFGVLNANENVAILSLDGNDIIVSGSTNPLFLKDIDGDNFTFIGWQIEV